MAEKKTTAAKAAPKKAAEAKKTAQEQLVEKRVELLGYRKSLAAGELVNPRAITVARKDIARLLTTINQEKKGK